MIYLVEDDENIRALILYALDSSSMPARGFADAPAFWDGMRAEAPKLVLLDIMLPGDDGLSILRSLRQDTRTTSLPVIMLTAKASEYDKVTGLDQGADDYITKPFGVMELLSRIRAVLRRAGGAPARDALDHGGIHVDEPRREVRVQGALVELTYKEYELLTYLMRNREIALSRERITEQVWGYDFQGESRTVDMHIKSLRQKLGVCGELIVTVRGVGYKFAPQE